MPEKEDSETITVQAKGRTGQLDPAAAEVTATVYRDFVRVRVDSSSDPAFWMEIGIPLKGTPAAPGT